MDFNKKMNKVLVVDDNDLSVKIIQQAMTSLGCVVVEAFNGIEGIIKATEELPDLIFMDIKMPTMNGIDSMKWIREQSSLKDVPIIAYTASSLYGDRNKLLEDGFDDYISKPVTLSGLVEKVGKYLFKKGSA